MDITTRCPCCRGETLTTVAAFRYRRPDVNPDTDRGRLLNNIALERLWLLFARIVPGTDVLDVQVLRCSSCSFYFTSPRPSADDIRTKYAVLEELGLTRERYTRHPASRLDVRAERVRAMLGAAGCLPDHGNILDFGGAWGYNLIPLRPYGHCYVVDAEQWTLPEGVAWLGRDLADIAPDLRFDLVLFLHTLEHVPDPLAEVEALVAKLNPGGALYVEVPLGVFREVTNLSEPMTHLNFFGEHSLVALFERCGLTVVHLSTAYQWITTGSQWCVNIVGVRGGAPRPRTRAPMPDRVQRYHPWYYAVAAGGRLWRRARAALRGA